MAGNPQNPAFSRPEMIVIGGGPAGAVSAWLAARDGLRVLLIDPEKPSGRVEGLSPRLHRWLESTGIGDGGTTIGPFPRRVDWANQPQSVNAEHAVHRDRFDAHLRDAARAAGACVFAASAQLSGREVTLPDGRRLTARWIIDARGRQGRHGERGGLPFSTLSICGWYRPVKTTEPGFDITALPEGWLWRAALPDGRIWAQLTTDARSAATMETRLTRALLHSGLTEGEFTVQAPLLARASTPLLPAPITDLTCLPVGDALAAMDPLSGHGLFWAVSSALSAAAARRTLTARPAPQTEALCRRYLDNRARETYLRNARIGRDFLSLETRFADQPFWSGRAGFPDNEPSHSPITRPEIRPGMVLRNGLIEEMDLLFTPQETEGVGWFGEIPAVPFWQAVCAGQSGAELARRWGPVAIALHDRLARYAPPVEA
ncbi:flavin-dependent monooxygenase QhpG [Mameliella sediminis]|uniref:flavin-dependent monooxygenase QhpG n=1 Tax=Mameliella sediminis TaxID=2836866 RepID=UPI001FE68977|nr:NAD(P)-binding protein [Mameliella sediminis]